MMIILMEGGTVVVVIILGAAVEIFGDGHELNVGGSLVDGANFDVAVELLDGIGRGEADAAEPLEGAAGDALGDLRAEELGHGGLFHDGVAGGGVSRDVVGEAARGLEVAGGLGHLELHSLKIAQGTAELRPFLEVPKTTLFSKEK